MRSELEATDRLLDDGQTVGQVTRRASKGPRAALMLLSMVRQVHPKSIIEMGTCVGISGSYLAAGLRVNGGDGRLITLEGNPERCAIAIAVFDRLGLAVDARVGLFSETFVTALHDADPVDLLFIDGHHEEEPTVAYFREALPHMAPGAVVVFDDIGWSDGMRRAWASIGSCPEVALHVNAGGVGIVRLV
jgi:predicted O-methyltransferase YrrM